MRKSLKISAGVLLFVSLNFFCKTATGNFSLDLLAPSEKFAEKSPSDPGKVLDQEYRYLGHGNQAFVFLSEDGEHVLKLFRPLAPSWERTIFGKKLTYKLGKIPFMQTAFNYLYAKEIAEDRDEQFLSYTNSFTLLKKETGIEHLHLAPTSHLKRSMKIYDKIGILHTIDLDNTSFLIQKKTDLLYPSLAKFIKNKEIGKAKELLSNFAKLSLQLTEKGIIRPTTLKKNLGCVGVQPVQIDIGKVFREGDRKKDPVLIPVAQVQRYNGFMKEWLSSRDKELLDHLEKEEKELLEKASFL